MNTAINGLFPNRLSRLLSRDLSRSLSEQANDEVLQGVTGLKS